MTKIKKDITVAAPVDVVYGAWRNFENFPAFMGNIEEVHVIDDEHSHWKAKGPLGVDAEWDAEITLDEPQKALGWRSVQGNTSVMVAGRVNFEPAGDQTKLDVTIEYAPPAGPLGDVVAKIFSNPEKQVEEDLNRFRDVMESGQEFVRRPMNGDGQAYGSSMGGATDDDLPTGASAELGELPPTGTNDDMPSELNDEGNPTTPRDLEPPAGSQPPAGAR